MKTSFLICNYNSDDLLLRCITSILNLNNDNIDIYVYDNCSTDNSLDIVIQKFGQSAIHFIKGNSNLGYPKAINSIAKIATGENIFILNPDAVLLFSNHDFIELINSLEYNHIAGFQIYNESNELQNFDPQLPGLFWLNSSLIRFIYPFISNLFYKFYFKFKKNNINNNQNLILIPGCSLLLKRELFCDLGMYNEDYFLYFDDTELLYKAHQKMCYTYLSNLKIKHNASYTVNRLENLLKVEKYKSFLIYVKKMYSIKYYKRAKLNLFILCGISFLSPSVLLNKDKRNYFNNLFKMVIKN
jgi:GT2 family glycosyltransferase